MKKYLIITYFAHFISDKSSQHDTFERFWFWKAPQFFDWITEKRKNKENQLKCNLVVTNCGKIK